MKLLKRININKSIPFLWIVLSVISTLFIMIYNNNENNWMIHVKTIILSVIVTVILLVFVLDQQIKVGDIPYFNLVVIGAYLVTLLLILSTNGNGKFPVWVIGSLVISTIINVNLGLIVLYHHLFLASFLSDFITEQGISVLIFGIVMCILAKHMKERRLLKYIIMIIVFLDLVLEFVNNDFMIYNMLLKEVLISIILDVILVVTTYIIFSYYNNKMKQQSLNKMDIEEDLNIRIPDGQVSYVVYNMDTMNAIKSGTNRTTELLDEFITPDFILLKELRRYSSNLYKHSRKVGRISCLAAKAIGANEKLALAGGLYHEVGRMRDGDYVQVGLNLIKQYNMPNSLGDMIRQQNIKYEIPKSPEAAILMLTLSILTTKDKLENNTRRKGVSQEDTKHSLPIKKIVDYVFDMRLSKHSLDESGLTIAQYNQLKEFYTTDILYNSQ